jgi:hypothetical protein
VQVAQTLRIDPVLEVGGLSSPPSRQRCANHVAFCVFREPEVAARQAVGELGTVDAQQVEAAIRFAETAEDSQINVCRILL